MPDNLFYYVVARTSYKEKPATKIYAKNLQGAKLRTRLFVDCSDDQNSIFISQTVDENGIMTDPLCFLFYGVWYRF